MGIFLSLTSVVGKEKAQVLSSLTRYAKSEGGNLRKENLSVEDHNCCVIEQENGNTTVFNPYYYLEWDRLSRFISSDLSAPVFSFHIHDGDFWMYDLFVNGEYVDHFNPMPDYWGDNLEQEELESWKGNADIVAKYIPGVKQESIRKYLVRWNLDTDEIVKAYPDDQFAQEDWQMLDFMKKLKLPYPLNDDDTPRGETFEFWTSDFPLKPQSEPITKLRQVKRKSWWKFW